MISNRVHHDRSGQAGCVVCERMAASRTHGWIGRTVAITVTRFAIVSILVVLCASASTFAQEDLNGARLVVAEFAWTNVVNSEGNIDQRFDNRAPVAPIVFWTKVHGTRNAMESLRRENRLPIWHKWFVNCGSTYRFDRSIDPIDAIDLGDISTGSIVQELQIELDNRGYFDWRTWSKKERVSSCSYTVRVVDNRDSPLYCQEVNGDCEITIRLGN